jgi:outer membrane protein TolC
MNAHRSVKSYVASLSAQQSLAPAIPPSRRSVEIATPSEFTFTEACARAARFDKDLASALADAAQSQLDFEQAHSVLWPRANLRTYFQIPLGSGNFGDVQKFSGGVFLGYDFNALLFYKDETAAARATIESKSERIRVMLQQLTHDLFLLLSNREALKTEVTLRSALKSEAWDALQTANVLARTGQIKPERIYEFQNQYEMSVRLYQESVRQLADMNRTLGDRLFVDGAENIVVTDFPELLASIDEVTPAAKPDEVFFSALWEKRHDTKLLEAELYLKEMAVIDQRRKRIPRFTASVGAGSNSLTSTYTQAPFVIQLGVYMPLIDFGDIRRGISKADIDRDLVKRNITMLFLQIYRNVNDAAASFSESIDARKAADDYCNQLARQEENNQELVTDGLADPIDMFGSKERAGEAEIEVTRARMNVTKAAAEYAWTSQLDIVSGLDNQVLARLGSNPFASSGKAK